MGRRAARLRTDRRRTAIRRADIAFAAMAVGVLLLAGACLLLLGGPRAAPAAAIGGPFALTQDRGAVVTQRDFLGHYVLIYFGYTACPDVCPTTLAAVADALGILGRRAERLRPVFITIDPQRDTPDVLRAYASHFSPAITALSGTPAEIRTVEHAYRITSILRPGRDGYTIDHTSVLYLMAPDGSYLAPLPASDTGPELAKALAQYL
jgi:protein SCO1/2